jgi:tetratricopeptide (TPR) repeat protein
MKLSIAVVLLTLGLAPAAVVASPRAQQANVPEADRVHAVQFLLQARSALVQVEIGNERDVLLGIVGLDLAKIGQTAEARQTIDIITSDESRDVYLRPFLQILLASNDLAEAQRTVESMKTLGGRAEGLCYLATAQWRAGEQKRARRPLSEAEAMYKKHRDELTYENFLEPLATAQSEMGDSVGASETRRAIAIAKLKGVGPGIGDSWRPEWVASGSASYELLVAGRSEAKKGDLESARATFQRAVASISSVHSEYAKATLLYVIAVDQAKAGDLVAARSTFALAVGKALAGLQSPERNYVLRDIALAQVEAGEIDGSMTTAAKISDVPLRDQALHGIAIAKLTQSDFDSGMAIAQEIQTPSEHDATLVDTAHFLAKQRDLSNLHFVVEQIKSPYLKAEALREAAEVLGHVGYFSEH